MIDNNEQNPDINNVSHIDTADTAQEPESLKSIVKPNDIIDSKNDQIIQLETKLIQLKDRERDTVLRLQAEIENINRRHIQDMEKTHKFALERFILELLPVIDNLERTLNIMDRSNTALSSIIEGIDLTLKSFLDTMYKFGVESVHEIHVAFNPEIHQAISTVESDECESNQVLQIIQKGYMLNGRLIRPAMVMVSRSKC